MYTVSRNEARLIRAYREQLACLNGLTQITEARRKASKTSLLDNFINDMKNAV